MTETGRRYLSRVNCTPELAQKSFMATKNLYGKADGIFFYQYVQSFSPKEEVTPGEAHQIAQELAERFFPGCEVLVATHMDTEHLHSHLIVNSVHPDTGKKLHFTPNTLEQMRKVSDQLCEEHGLSTLKPYQQDRRTQGLRAGEYRAASRGESWKFQLIIVIEEVMKRAGTREEFLREMNQQGYKVCWEEGRKNITYTTPTGKKCRDDKLHELKFRKEQMEHEFRIRQRAAQQRAGRSEAEAEGVTNHANPDGPAGQHPLYHAAPDSGAVGAGPAEHPGPPGEHPERDGFPGHQKEPGTSGHSGPAGPLAEPDGGSPSGDVPGPGESPALDSGGEPTGWETERRIYETALRTGPGVPGG
ncbi:MAG: relaxase/mobilization nuclease domain-containing protein [Oscillospiraceae bacterium]|nr:relaxase/mobilization nuclease domain-containing protein [Oscillospiraceae bacterium]